MGEYVNSQQARFDKSHVSCGVMEVHHLPKGSASNTLFAMANALYNKANPRPAAFIIFSDKVLDEGKSRGQALADEIKKHSEFGDFWESKAEVNPRTGNTIKMYVLHLKHDAVRNWYKEELANRIQE